VRTIEERKSKASMMRKLAVAILLSIFLISMFIPLVGFEGSPSGKGNLIKKFEVRCDDGSLVDFDGSVSGYLYNEILGYNETFTVEIVDGRGRVVFCPLMGNTNYTLVYTWEGYTHEETIFVYAGEGEDCGYVNTNVTNKLHPTEERDIEPYCLII
jgi:hypothetical protein